MLQTLFMTDQLRTRILNLPHLSPKTPLPLEFQRLFAFLSFSLRDAWDPKALYKVLHVVVFLELIHNTYYDYKIQLNRHSCSSFLIEKIYSIFTYILLCCCQCVLYIFPFHPPFP